MAVTVQQVLDIARKVIGQRDTSAPDATDTDLLTYFNQFLQLEFPQDMKLFNEPTWYEFNTVVDQLEYTFNSVNSPGGGDINNVVFSNLMPPVYINNLRASWYQDLTEFFNKWGMVDDADIQSGTPTDILFWDNKLTVRPKPDAAVAVKIQGYPINATLTLSDNIPEDYWYRYLGYGVAVDFLSDFGEFELLRNVLPLYERYRALVTARTASQRTGQSGKPRF